MPPTIVRENIRRSIRRLRCFFVRGRCPRLIVCTCSRRISVTVGRSGWDGWAVGLCGNVGVSARAWFALHVAEVGLHRGIPADQQDRGPRTPRNSEYLGPPWIGTPTRPRAVQAIDSVPSHSRPSANGCGGFKEQRITHWSSSHFSMIDGGSGQSVPFSNSTNSNAGTPDLTTSTTPDTLSISRQ